MLFIDHAGDDQVAAEGLAAGLQPPHDFEVGREPRLHVTGAAPVDPPILDPRLEGLVVARYTDGIEVPGEHDRGAIAAATQPPPDVVAAVGDRLRAQFQPQFGQSLFIEARHGVFGRGRFRRAVEGIDAGGRDQRLQVGDKGGLAHVRSPACSGPWMGKGAIRKGRSGTGARARAGHHRSRSAAACATPVRGCSPSPA